MIMDGAILPGVGAALVGAKFKSLEKAIRCLEERSEWALGVLRSKYDEKEISSGISEDQTYISAECGDDSYYVKLFPSI